MRRDLRQQVELHETVELARRELVLQTQRAEQGLVEELGAGDPHADALGGRFGVEVRAQRDLGEGSVRAQARVVAVVAQVVEGFIGVLDRDLGAGRVGEEGADHGGVEVRAVRVGLVRRQDEELRNAGAAWEGGDGEGWRGEDEGFGFRGGGGGLVGEEAVGGGVADDGVGGGGGCGRGGELLVAGEEVSWVSVCKMSWLEAYTKKTRHRAKVHSWSSRSSAVPPSMKKAMNICMRSRRSRTEASVSSPHQISKLRPLLL